MLSCNLSVERKKRAVFSLLLFLSEHDGSLWLIIAQSKFAASSVLLVVLFEIYVQRGLGFQLLRGSGFQLLSTQGSSWRLY